MAVSKAAGVGIDEATRKRDVRGAEQPMGVWPVCESVWKVGTGSEDYTEYTVDLRGQRCSCDDWTYRGDPGRDEISRCKHIARIGMVLEAIAVPIEADVDRALEHQRERWSR